MKTFAAVSLALAAGSNALVARQSTCCFHLSASGGETGNVGQLSDGQNRIGGGLPEGQYCIDSNGGLTDQSSRGCILTPPTTQFQCDVGASPTSGFSVGNGGALSSNGNSQFYACPTGDNGSFNIYTTPVAGQSGCVQVSLTADNCAPAASPSPSPSPTPSPTSQAPPAATQSQCPAALTGNYEFPHLIVPVDSNNPNQAAGTSLNGTVTPSVSSIFNFDIPSSDSGKTCSLVFLFPNQSDLQTSSFSFSGSGSIDFASLQGTANAQTSFSNTPALNQDLAVITVAPGNSYNVASFACPAGRTVAFKLSTTSSTNLNYFQDFNPSPIGLYITVC
ncbi:MAG: hypothetical protein M1812_005956 [Candelaria pacifica]|nr:MAG: hypothetical protein M1812_005956 [Candelaria pacifica]